MVTFQNDVVSEVSFKISFLTTFVWQGSEDISLSVDNPQKLLVLGKSKDLGWCKGSKKDGGRCTMFVNK